MCGYAGRCSAAQSGCESSARCPLLILRDLASHLAGLPGEKQLIWITSDNALADWSSQTAAKEEQGPHLLDELAMRTLEALNGAHVRLYPVDASQLEGAAITADVQSRNVHAVGKTERDQATALLGDAAPGMKPGRLTAQLHQDTLFIRGEFRDLAEGTGGQALGRASDLAAHLDSIEEDNRGTYLLTFTPDGPPDDRYHRIEVRISGGKKLKVHYRTGYDYTSEPASLRDRFRDAVWEAVDRPDIALRAHWASGADRPALELKVGASDLMLVEDRGRQRDTLDVFVAARSVDGTRATVTGQKYELQLSSDAWSTIIKGGLSLTVPVSSTAGGALLRVIVVDENAERIGSLSVPANSF